MSAGAPDFFYKEAQRLRYVARSAFKLLEMQKKYGIIKPGASVLDLGCAPGAWLQVACQNLGSYKQGGAIIGVDVKKVKVPVHHCDNRVQTVCADVMKISSNSLNALSPMGKGYKVILSDMCPAVSGIATRDSALSAELGRRALDFSLGHFLENDDDETANKRHKEGFDGAQHQEEKFGILLPGGNVIIKLLEGEESQGIFQLCKGHFKLCTWFRPKATRSSSREIYLIGKGRENNVNQ
ncbi:hypothetical protein O6H91_10G101900 [Diphasiastrum complanatum]|uniref:Uncharacterized protein n=3 Tax=Diphasiastrum complanatum TaxID=34168 RepID=A0ACC2ANX7_DIPCM|nr:hypothetical protein O6H91_20G026900 [Diphasiastrum complanatum]KAJ7542344.1 hypothetical protein O6H91_10G101900 [Diphasiastrum complanatum]